MGSTEFTFSKFAGNVFYQRVNKWLVDSLDLGSSQRIVDLACGTGALTRLILEKVRDTKDTFVLGIDQSASALRHAVEDLGHIPNVAVQFVQGQVEQVAAALTEKVDTVVFGNGIHLIPDKKQLMSAVFDSLRPGGVFAFNTTFFDGGIPSESEQFYRRWMSKSIRNLRSTYGLMPQRDKVEARRQFTAQQYRELLEEEGFIVTKEELIPVDFPLEGHEDISKYEDFINGALPGVPLEMASQVLQEAARQSYEELGITSVPRNWLQLVAVRSNKP